MKAQIDGTNLVFSHIDVPFNAFRNTLYTAETLYEGYELGNPDSYKNCFDNKVYQHYLRMGKTATDVKETLARTLHDRAISDSVHELLSHYDERKIIGIMGGHGLLRTDPMFRKIVCISKQLTECGYLMVSGGGPGAMEATHLGAFLAGRTEEDVDEALNILSTAPSYKDREWLDTAMRVIDSFRSEGVQECRSVYGLTPNPSPKAEGSGYNPSSLTSHPSSQSASPRGGREGAVSLGIPTWLYGHEPATPFASHIAKYFENAIREDSILTIAKGGIIYSPGSAGTMQEIFQDAVQNHYLSFGYASPMIFLGTDYWIKEMPVYPLLQQLSATGKYKNLILSIGDEVEEIVESALVFVKENK
jgi:predicted Rossmann-fold nucleotide-binding protein